MINMYIPSWMYVAFGEGGQKEVEGPQHNPRIVEYHSKTSLQASEDEVPWCAAFVNWVLFEAGFQGTGLANARSYLDWGIPLEEPNFGCIVILKRTSNPAFGHVGFYLAQCGTDGSKFVLWGGNQSNRVGADIFKNSDVIGYRYPSGAI